MLILVLNLNHFSWFAWPLRAEWAHGLSTIWKDSTGEFCCWIRRLPTTY